MKTTKNAPALNAAYAAVVGFAASRGAKVRAHRTLAGCVVVKAPIASLLTGGTLNRIKSDGKVAAGVEIVDGTAFLVVTAHEAIEFAINHNAA